MMMTRIADNKLRGLAADVAERCIARKMRAASRVVTRVYNDELAPWKITAAQFTLLTAILLTEPAAPSDVAAVASLDKSTLSRNLELLRRNGWITTDGSGRGQVLAVSQAGAAIFAAAYPAWRKAQRQTERMLSTKAGLGQ
jgi:DNA-binding MarR family transcriptional regulator